MPQRHSPFNNPLPNSGSKLQTESSVMVDLHYAKLDLVRRWNLDRFNRLASFLQLTHAELASMVCLTHRRLTKFLSCENSRLEMSVCLLLTLLEAQVMQAYTKDVIENPFPKLK